MDRKRGQLELRIKLFPHERIRVVIASCITNRESEGPTYGARVLILRGQNGKVMHDGFHPETGRALYDKLSTRQIILFTNA